MVLPCRIAARPPFPLRGTRRNLWRERTGCDSDLFPALLRAFLFFQKPSAVRQPGFLSLPASFVFFFLIFLFLKLFVHAGQPPSLLFTPTGPTVKSTAGDAAETVCALVKCAVLFQLRFLFQFFKPVGSRKPSPLFSRFPRKFQFLSTCLFSTFRLFLPSQNRKSGRGFFTPLPLFYLFCYEFHSSRCALLNASIFSASTQSVSSRGLPCAPRAPSLSTSSSRSR